MRENTTLLKYPVNNNEAINGIRSPPLQVPGVPGGDPAALQPAGDRREPLEVGTHTHANTQTHIEQRHIAPGWSRGRGGGNLRTAVQTGVSSLNRIVSGKTLSSFQQLSVLLTDSGRKTRWKRRKMILFALFCVSHYGKQGNLTTGVFGIIKGMWLRAAQMKLLNKGEHYWDYYSMDLKACSFVY